MDYFDKAGSVLFASPECDEAVAEAKQWAVKNRMKGLVKILKHNGMILIVRQTKVE